MGGAGVLFFKGNSASKVLRAGANGIMVGDYLTVKGVDMDDDMKNLNINLPINKKKVNNRLISSVINYKHTMW